MIDLFGKAGFNVDILDIRRWEVLPTPRHKMDSQFTTIPNDELCVSGLRVRLNKT